MHARLDGLITLRAGLRALPPVPPPAHAWDRLARALDAGEGARPTPTGRLPAHRVAWRVAAAMALAGLVSALAFAPWPSMATGPQVAALVMRSQRLESALRQLPDRPAVEQVASTATIDALESRIRRVDAELAGEPRGHRERELWQSRVQLLDSLVSVRYAEAVRAGHPLQASLVEQGVSL